MMIGQMDAGTVTSFLGNVVTLGIGGAFAWYMLSKMIPKILEDHKTVQADERARYLTAQAEERTRFLADRVKEREWYDTREERSRSDANAALAVIIRHCEEETKRGLEERERMNAQHAEERKVEGVLITNALNDVRTSLDEFTDMMREFMNQQPAKRNPRTSQKLLGNQPDTEEPR